MPLTQMKTRAIVLIAVITLALLTLALVQSSAGRQHARGHRSSDEATARSTLVSVTPIIDTESARAVSSRVLIVSATLATITRSGLDLGPAASLAYAIRGQSQHALVDMLYTPYPYCVNGNTVEGPTAGNAEPCRFLDAVSELRDIDVDLHLLYMAKDRPHRSDRYAWRLHEPPELFGETVMQEAYRFYEWLLLSESSYDVIFLDGSASVGYYALAARRLGYAFKHITFVTHLQEPVGMRLHTAMQRAMAADPDGVNNMLLSHMNRFVVDHADVVLSPTESRLAVLEEHYSISGLVLVCPRPRWQSVDEALLYHMSPQYLTSLLDLLDGPHDEIPLQSRSDLTTVNVAMTSRARPAIAADSTPLHPRRIVFYGRASAVYGLDLMLSVLEQIAATSESPAPDEALFVDLGPDLESNPAHVRPVNFTAVVSNASSSWRWPWRVIAAKSVRQLLHHPELNLTEATLAVVPAPSDVSADIIEDLLDAGQLVIAMRVLGVEDLFHPTQIESHTVPPDAASLYAALHAALSTGLSPTVPRYHGAALSLATLQLLIGAPAVARKKPVNIQTSQRRGVDASPPVVSVVVVIERAETALPTLLSIVNQSHRHLEIVLVDATREPGALNQSLVQLAPAIRARPGPTHVRVVPASADAAGCRPCARNAGLRVTSGSYVTYVDGGDEMLPFAIASSVAGLRHADVDVLVPLTRNTVDESVEEAIILYSGPALEAAIQRNVFGPYHLFGTRHALLTVPAAEDVPDHRSRWDRATQLALQFRVSCMPSSTVRVR
eukprot:m.256644 g.256644  ORF g.256644 m.256644 type:complete len:780 (-) comp20302_c0_seq1:186-2525(-)